MLQLDSQSAGLYFVVILGSLFVWCFIYIVRKVIYRE